MFTCTFFLAVKITGEKNIKKYGKEDLEILNPCHVSNKSCYCLSGTFPGKTDLTQNFYHRRDSYCPTVIITVLVYAYCVVTSVT